MNLENKEFENADEHKTDVVDNGNKPADKPEDIKTETDEKLFTQEQLDKIVKDRLEREKRKQEAELEEARLKEQGNYKELLEKAQQTIAELENERTAYEQKQSISTKLNSKGIVGEDVDKYFFYVKSLIESGKEEDEAVQQVVSDFVTSTQNAFGDATQSLGKSVSPDPKSNEDLGREMFARLRK